MVVTEILFSWYSTAKIFSSLIISGLIGVKEMNPELKYEEKLSRRGFFRIAAQTTLGFAGLSAVALLKMTSLFILLVPALLNEVR